MTVLPPPPGYDKSRTVRDIGTGHPVLQARWIQLVGRLARLKRAAFPMFVNEVYRYDLRQQYLYGSGRTAEELAKHGIPASFARPSGPWLTNAYSAATSAHGWTRRDESGILVPAAAALDVVPLGKDGKPYSKDDPWDEFLSLLKEQGYQLGLVHFHKPGKAPTDTPHLQLAEWSDAKHSLDLP